MKIKYVCILLRLIYICYNGMSINYNNPLVMLAYG